MVKHLGRHKLPFPSIMLNSCLFVKGLVSLFIYVVEYIVFHKLIKARILPLERLLFVSSIRFNRILLYNILSACVYRAGLCVTFLIYHDLTLLKIVTST